MRKIMLFSISLLVGCFDPDLTTAQLLCDSSHFCPDGFSCIAGICQMGSGSGSSDGGVLANSGCSDGKGSDVSGSVAKPAWACPGTYQALADATKNATRLCAAGFSICTMADTINLSTCNNVNGFYLADVPARFGFGNSSCGTAGNNQSAAWAGCGKSTSNINNIMCGNFTKAMVDWQNQQLDINSPFSPLATTTQNDASTNGVLCCKN